VPTNPLPARSRTARFSTWLRDVRDAGHAPSLLAALLHFDVSFMAWVLLGALGAYVAEDLALSGTAAGVLVATPLLSAAFFRVAIGMLGDRYGPRRVGLASLAVTLVPLAWGGAGGAGYPKLLAVGLLLGVAGASFAISLPLASRWYPPHRQGLAMGIAGAGNSGTVVTALLAPRLAEQVGWQAVLALATIPVALVLVAFAALAREPPAAAHGSPSLRRVLREPDAWRLCGLYAVTFGGFVGLATSLPILLHVEYGLSKVDAGSVTACGAALGSLLRPIGGHVADRIGGTIVLALVYALAAAALAALATRPPTALAVLGFPAAMAVLGVGNGAAFQLVGLRYGGAVGTVTGLVGAAGGLGGFALPVVLGATHDLAGGYGLGLALVASGMFAGFVTVAALRTRWRVRWHATAGARV
jgi:MFS transporter, NNP family, nitrate/nitrite transporter